MYYIYLFIDIRYYIYLFRDNWDSSALTTKHLAFHWANQLTFSKQLLGQQDSEMLKRRKLTALIDTIVVASRRH